MSVSDTATELLQSAKISEHYTLL